VLSTKRYYDSQIYAVCGGGALLPSGGCDCCKQRVAKRDLPIFFNSDGGLLTAPAGLTPALSPVRVLRPVAWAYPMRRSRTRHRSDCGMRPQWSSPSRRMATPGGFEARLSPGLEPIANVISQRPEHANRQRSP
jgi:hypothetical protein